MDDADPIQVLSRRMISRRRFLQGTAASVFALPALRGLSVLAETNANADVFLAASQCQRFGVFDDHTFATLAAIAAQIVPTDSQPGASEVCTTSFIELSAAGNPDLKELLTSGVAGIDQSGTLLFGADFVSLTFANQTEVLKRLEAGTAPGTFWNSALFRNYVASKGQPVPPGLKKILGDLSHPAGPLVKKSPNLVGQNAQQVVFGTCRSMTKLAWVINWPEAFVRDPATGQPFFADSAHLISDPDIPGTGTCWEVIRFHVIDWEVEQLLWAWQAGMKVTGFEHGWPTFARNPLNDSKRLAARDQLYALSDQGEA
jgi:Gluconate 2-dehydrogenase subunit 3